MRCIAMVVIFTALLAPTVRAAEPSPRQIDQAIEKGKQWLYKQQNEDGTWEVVPQPETGKIGGDVKGAQWGGQTALVVYALLVSGEKPTEPKLEKAIDFLQKNPNITGTYALAVKCQVWLSLPQKPEVKAAIRRDASLLRQSMRANDAGLAVWDYGPIPRKNVYSLSRSQYGALGLWAAGEMGVEQPPDLWRQIERTWEASQTPEGGWRYQAPADLKGDAGMDITTVAMTASGLATLYIAQDFTKSSVHAQGRGNAKSEPIERGFKFLIEKFDTAYAVGDSPPREYPYPLLYSVERVGLASGLRRFGPHDWYAKGAAWLVDKQKSAGNWSGSGSNFNTTVNTSFALLFLQRGRTPVAFNKLDYTAAADDAKTALWNQRPRDIANVTRWLDRTLERELRWQVVGVDEGAAALLEAPVLYVAGGAAVKFNDAAKAALKDYALRGGLIVAHADTADAGFAKAMTALGKELFGPADWRDLPATHPIHNNQNFKIDTMKTKPALRGIGNGVRELMILMPSGDHGRAWQLRNANARTESWQVMANVLSYATGKTTFYARGNSWLAPESKATAKKTFTVGRLKYDGNHDPEPQAWAQLSNHALAKTGTSIKTAVVEAGKPVDKDVKLLHVAGTTAFNLNDDARAALKAYVDGGGTLLFEAAGGNGEFAAAAQGEIAKLFGSADLKALPASHPIYAAAKDAKPFAPEYRPFRITSIANPTAPQLAGLERDGRVVALLSREDILTGLLGVPTDGIVGYQPASARELMTRVIAALK